MSDETDSIEALLLIKELLNNKDRYCKYTTACDDKDNPTEAHSEDATSWCIEGAYYKLHLTQNIAVRYLHESAERLYRVGLIEVNDSIGYEAILNVIDDAISFAIEIDDAVEMG